MRFSDEKVAASRNFANKIWNAARFILMNIEGKEIPTGLPEQLSTADRWIVEPVEPRHRRSNRQSGAF